MTAELLQDRLNRRKNISDLGVDPYGSSYGDSMPIDGIRRTPFKNMLKEPVVRTAGRIISKNDRGKLVFFHIKDSSASIQVMISKDKIESDSTWKVIQNIQVGDIVGIEGHLGETKTGEITIKVFANEGFTFLTKSLSLPPDKFHGLTDVETLHRNRHLELVHSETALKNLQRRSRMVWNIRQCLAGHNFTEVETPILQSIAGGAAARPFETHHNAMGMDLYLRIAPELYLKKLLVGGMERIYEIGKNFRNEGIDKTHNPEFTMLELYEAYGDDESMMYLTRKICGTIGLDNVENGAVVTYSSLFQNIGITLFEKAFGQANIQNGLLSWTPDCHYKLAEKAGLPVTTPLAELLDTVFDRFIQPTLVDATFVVGYPTILCPLAKPDKDWNSLVCERWELFVGGMEIANAYTELNDPDLQRLNFERQLGIAPGTHDPRIDYDYLDALMLGMPPAGGLGIGIDRLAMLVTETDAIRDVITFPLVKSMKNG